MKELPIKEQTDRFYELAGILESSSILGKQAEAFRSRIERRKPSVYLGVIRRIQLGEIIICKCACR